MRLGLISLLGVVALAAVACLDFDVFEGPASPGGAAGATGGGGLGGSAGDGGHAGDGGTGGGIPESCTNRMQDGTESDIDCGGICPDCPNDKMCGNGQDCQSGYCALGTCAACTVDANCADLPDSWCDTTLDGGSCAPLEALGSDCVNPNECLSGICGDDVCCDAACPGLCESCLGALTGRANGTCAPIAGTTDPADECVVADEVCTGTGTCGALCGMTPPATETVCPSDCTGGCSGDVCHIDCQSNNCNGDVVTCPAGWPCSVVCGGNNRCDNAIINCPDYHACDVTCSGTNSCRDADMNCSTSGTCTLACGSGSNACDSMSLDCGANTCAATCTSSTPSVTCGSSCSCTTC